MNDMTHASPYGTITEPLALTIQRKLPGPIDRIWAYLTESDLRRQWLASGTMPGEAGAPFPLTWRNAELATSPEGRPEGFPEEHSMESEVLVFEPPHLLVFAWPPQGEVSFELRAVGNDVLLTLTHKRISDRRNMVMIGAGWHMHLDILVARASGAEPPSFWQGWSRLRDEYEGRIPA